MDLCSLMASNNLSGNRTCWKASNHKWILSDSHFQQPLAVSWKTHSREAGVEGGVGKEGVWSQQDDSLDKMVQAREEGKIWDTFGFIY